MGSLYKKDVVALALSEEGYQGGKKTSKYSKELDEINYWNMGAKDGSADWCSIFVNWCVYRSTRNADGEIDPDKWDAHYFTFEPDSGENLGAGCGYSADYYMSHDAWSEGGSDYSSGACVGDQIFFRNFAHTGLVYDWDDEFVYTVEGNVNGNRVETRRYKLNDPSIDGYGHIRYDGEEYSSSDDNGSKPEPTPDPEPTPVPNPEPEPDPEPYTMWFRVHTNGGILRLRSAPNTSSAYLIGIPNGTSLESDEIVEGEEINGDTRWAHTTYKGYTGYVSCAWLD